jgi:hypothetical protein
MQWYHEDSVIYCWRCLFRGKGMTQIYVGSDGDEWIVKTETQALGLTRTALRPSRQRSILLRQKAKPEMTRKWSVKLAVP